MRENGVSAAKVGSLASTIHHHDSSRGTVYMANVSNVIKIQIKDNHKQFNKLDNDIKLIDMISNDEM